MTQPSRRRSIAVEKPIEEPPRDIEYNERTGEYEPKDRVQWDKADAKLGTAADTVVVTVATKSKEITDEIALLTVKEVCAEAGKEDLLAKWAGLAKGAELKHSDGIVLQHLATGKRALRLEVKVQNRVAWDSVEKGVSATTMINGTDPHFEYVRCGGIVLIRCHGDAYAGNDLAFEMLRAFANAGKASYGYMTKVRNKRSINHPRALVISTPGDEKAVQAVVDNLGSKRHVVSDLAALDDKPDAQSTGPEPEVGHGVQQEPLQPPAFEEVWDDGRWAQHRTVFLELCASSLHMDREVAFLGAAQQYTMAGPTLDAADLIVAEFLAPSAPNKIHVVEVVAEEVCRKVTEERDVQADTFTPAVDELTLRFRETYNQLYQHTAGSIRQAAGDH